jgi:hypothetical protein
MEERRASLAAIVADMRPMTVRQVFYQATVHGIVEKSEAGYARVQTDLVHLRREGLLPYGWIVDNTRWVRGPRTWSSIEDALEETARLYRKALWQDAGARVEIWLEKDALSGVVWPVLDEYDVALMVTRGYASLSFLHAAAEAIEYADCPVWIYHLGDYDPSGVDAGRKIEAELHRGAPDAEIHFERLSVTPEQIDAWNLPTRPTKHTDSRAKHFGAVSVELDAIAPQALRDLVRQAIERHLPRREIEALQRIEAEERRTLAHIVDLLGAGS